MSLTTTVTVTDGGHCGHRPILFASVSSGWYSTASAGASDLMPPVINFWHMSRYDAVVGRAM